MNGDAWQKSNRLPASVGLSDQVAKQARQVCEYAETRESNRSCGSRQLTARFLRVDVLRILAAGLGSALFAGGKPGGATAAAPQQAAMERVTGIGGFFFRARNPEALAQWYDTHLGVLPVPTTEGGAVWHQDAGATAFAPFPESTHYFGDPSKMWMINFRVRDLAKMVAQLRAAGVTVKVDDTPYPNGRFAHLNDPDGNPIELWEPNEAG